MSPGRHGRPGLAGPGTRAFASGMPSDESLAPSAPGGDPLEALVAEALECLDRGGDAALQAFLAAHPAERGRIEAVVVGFRATGLLVRDRRADLPERLGEFRLGARLGSGGMGVVFVAEQESLKRTVALKVIRPDLVWFAGTRERFRREIDIIARLSHPAIVPIVATGEHDGVPWYAMPLVPGCSADEVVRRLAAVDPATADGMAFWHALHGDAAAAAEQYDRSAFAGTHWQTCVRLVRQAALGLEHAHRQGVVHRDVKPSNLMLTPDGRALLLDFGLARAQGDPKLTRTGSEPGSPAYMAPEQVRGRTADERTDVYSLAATLLHLLDLAPPFQAEDAEGLRAAILRGRETGPSNRALPPELRIVLAVAMDVDRDRRYPTAAAFADDLEAVLARRPIRAKPVPRRVRCARWLQRHRRTANALLVAAALAVVVPAVIAWQQARSLDAVRAGKQVAERHRDQALFAIQQFLTQFASGRLTSLPGSGAVTDRLLQSAMELLDTMPADVDPALLRQHRTHAGRWWVSSLLRRGETAEARARAEALLAEWKTLTPTPSMAFLLASLRHELVRTAMLGSDVPDLTEHRRAAERECDVAAADPDLAADVVELRVRLAMDHAEARRRRGERADFRAELQAALAALDGAPATPQLVAMRAVVHNRLGDHARERGERAAAAAHFAAAREALAVPPDTLFGPADWLALRAHALWGLGRLEYEADQDAAAALLREARDEFDRSVHAFPDDALALANFAGLLTESAQVEARRGAAADAVLALLERGRRLYRRAAAIGAAGALAVDGRKINLAVLADHCWQRRDGAALAGAARELAAAAAGDAPRLAMAALRLLQAAELLGAAGEHEGAAACDADALTSLSACDAAGWFAPIDLDDAPCRRLQGRPEFDALRARHPPEQASRRRTN